ncbi:1-aminocyclopropane-1-carboxylate oxidase homolog 1-like protein [Tanacetum coccineum]
MTQSLESLIDAEAGGLVDIPKIFIWPTDELAEDLELTRTSLRVPTIDLTGVGDKGGSRREKIVEEVKHASENWGFFQVVNHGVPMKVLQDMLNGVHTFIEFLELESTVDYLNHLMKLVDTLFELLSEALGLEPNHLKLLECEKGRSLDEVQGLQVMHQNQWANVKPIPGALVVNIGDLLQIISNDRFKSVIHRVLGNVAQTRTSVACFFHGVATPPKIYGPIQKVITEDSPQVFREFTVIDYMIKFQSRGLDEKSGLNYVRL